MESLDAKPIASDYSFYGVLAAVPWGFRDGRIAFWSPNTFQRSLDGCLLNTSFLANSTYPSCEFLSKAAEDCRIVYDSDRKPRLLVSVAARLIG